MHHTIIEYVIFLLLTVIIVLFFIHMFTQLVDSHISTSLKEDFVTKLEIKVRKLFNIKPSEEALKEFMGEE